MKTNVKAVDNDLFIIFITATDLAFEPVNTSAPVTHDGLQWL